MTRPDQLTVWLDTTPVATIEEHKGRVRLRYLPEVLAAHAGQPLLSCALPVQHRPFDATNFFDGVLPEGQFRAVLAARASVSAADTFGLLIRYGRDVAGALVVTGADEPMSNAAIDPLSHGALEDEVASLPDQPLGIHDDSELSIAGMQNKLLLVKLEDGWGRPLGGAASTHILKLDSQSHPGVVTAEVAAMKLAKAVGLTTVDIELSNISDIDCLIVERFDRTTVDGQTRRIHQEDMCQALDLPAIRKYELAGRGADRSGGGPEFAQVAGLLDEFADDQLQELQRLAKVATFTALIGNADAHGKNLALLHHSASEVTLAPLYDTVPTVLFPRLKDEAAMTIGGATNLNVVNAATIAQEASLWHFDTNLATGAARDVAQQVLDCLDDVVEANSEIEQALVKLVRNRAERFLRP